MHRRIGRSVGERSRLDFEEIGKVVAVKIEDADSRAHRLDEVFLALAAVAVDEADSRRPRRVGEPELRGRSRRARGFTASTPEEQQGQCEDQPPPEADHSGLGASGGEATRPSVARRSFIALSSSPASW